MVGGVLGGDGDACDKFRRLLDIFLLASTLLVTEDH